MKILKLMSTGTEVELVQLALQRAGFYFDNIDGIYGENTRTAVINFQKSRGITQSGVAGVMTQNALVPYLKGYVTYKLKKGDTFYKIATQYNADLSALITANSSLNPDNLQIGTKINIPLNFPLVPTNVHYTSALNRYIVEGLVVRFPFISTGVVGKSVMSRPIPYLKIGEGDTELFYNASHHANEWLTTPVLLKFLEEYAFSYSVGSEIFNESAVALYNKSQLFVVPMVNPDGVDLVNDVINHDNYYYKTAVGYAENYPSIKFPSGWKANISGVDLNSQYPANWEKAKEIKFAMGYTSPAPRDYVGTAPLTAPESAAIYNFTKSKDFKLTLSYHSQGELIYWKYLDFEPPKSRQIADYFNSVSGYLVEETPYSSGFAGYKDWFIQEYNRPGYTIEIGKGVNPLPLSQFDKIFKDNIGILVGGITEI